MAELPPTSPLGARWDRASVGSQLDLLSPPACLRAWVLALSRNGAHSVGSIYFARHAIAHEIVTSRQSMHHALNPTP